MGEGERSFVPRQPFDLGRAQGQHVAYRAALEAMGCKVLVLPGDPAYPDCTFVEDVALVFDELAVATRPGAPSRRAEGAPVLDLLATHRPVAAIHAPATLDGGDVLRIGRTVYVGSSTRSDAEGCAQLAALLAPYGYEVRPVPVRDCLHLKTAATRVAADTVLLYPAWVDAGTFADCRVIEVDPSEPAAANALRIGESLLCAEGFPRTLQRLRAAGIAVTTVDMGEVRKAEGGPTCCSLVFRTQVRG